MLCDRGANQYQLGIGQSTAPEPAFLLVSGWRATSVEPHMLFQKAEHVLDGEAPEVHAAEVGQCDGLRTSPEEIERSFEASPRGSPAISLEEFDHQYQADQG